MALFQAKPVFRRRAPVGAHHHPRPPGDHRFSLLSTVFRAITWDFLTLPPTDSMTKGGIMPAIVGTFYLTVGAIVVALPLGVVSAIYLTEYAKQGSSSGSSASA